MRESILIHVPHGSVAIPDDVRKSILLTDEELAAEVLTAVDLYADELFALEGAARIVNEYCRTVFDPERFRDDAHETMAAHGLGAVYTHTSDGRPLRAISDEAREKMLRRFYDPYHERLERTVSGIVEKHGKCLIVDGHSFPSKPFPFEADQSLLRPDICVGTDEFHTPEPLAEAVEAYCARRGMSTKRNSPFAGAITPMKHYRKDARVKSVMIEVNRRLYMDESNGKKLPEFGRIQGFIQGMLEGMAALWSGRAAA
jgi:N-formylglutamate deformylase